MPQQTARNAERGTPKQNLRCARLFAGESHLLRRRMNPHDKYANLHPEVPPQKLPQSSSNTSVRSRFRPNCDFRLARLTRTAVSVALLLAACHANVTNETPNIKVQNQGGSRPKLVFACDRPTSELRGLFTPELISELKELGAGVALSTEDFSTERAQVVKQLNAAGVPMTAWLVLPKEQGYYVNAGNAPQTAARFAEFDRWTTQNSLRWEAVGLDIEPSLSDFSALVGHKTQLLSLVLRRAFDSARVNRARVAYLQLVRQMQSRGYFVQTYQLQFIADERRAHTTVLERIFGLVDVSGDDEVLMLYTTFSHGSGAGLIWAYGPDAQTVAVGTTASSGDVATDAKYPPLTWEEFSRDLIVARRFSPVIGVYSLEGCVRHGFISRLKSMDWNQPVLIPQASVQKAAKFRKGLHIVLWVGAHIIYFSVALLLSLAWLLNLIVRLWKRRRGRTPAGVTT